MSNRFGFQLADQAEDDALRTVLRQTSMPGKISLAFNREPSFFIAEQAGNIKNQTIVYKDQETGRIVGFGGRSVRRLYIDGDRKTIGYLSMLRLLPEFRGGTALARAYKHLRHLHSDGEVPYYFTTILSENVQAQSLLESGRASLPVYFPVGTLITYMIPIRKRRKVRKLDSRVDLSTEDLLPSGHECLDRWNRLHQLAPSYTLDDIAGKSTLLPSFFPKDFYIFRDRNKTLGTIGVWNQQTFKQTVVTDYSVGTKLVRPLYNGFAHLSGRPGLPKIGEKINSVYASFVSSENDDCEIFESLLARVCEDWAEKGHDYLIVGLCEGNKLESVVASFASRQLKSKVYLVHWLDDGITLPQNLQTLHLEVATL